MLLSRLKSLVEHPSCHEADRDCQNEQQQLRAAEAAHMQQFLTPDKWACITRLLLFLRTRKSGIKLPNPSNNNPDPLLSLLQSLAGRAGQGGHGLVKEEGVRGSKKTHGAGDLGDGLEGIESGALSSLKPLSVFLATDNENLRPQFVDKIGPVAGDVFFSTGAVTHTSKSGAAAAAAASAAAGGAGGAGGLEGRSEGEGGAEGLEGDDRQKAVPEEHFLRQPSPTMAEFFLLSRARVLMSKDPSAGVVPVEIKRVRCRRVGGVAFNITGKEYYVTAMPLNVAGDGAMKRVDISIARGPWMTMRKSYGAVWDMPGLPVVGMSLSFRLWPVSGTLPLEAWDAVPANWVSNKIYRTAVNFP
ncbi:unnamed protein product [Closterium sp. Naga37s-1]|nr:unnamed protein product [Closterium sp. Naga37s-1]